MLLICEKLEDVRILTEAREDGKKNYFIEGVFLQSSIKNRNGRMYPESVMDKEVSRYTKALIEQNRAYGELNHPPGPAINLDRVSHMIKSLTKEGKNYIGRALVLDTPMGKIAQNLIDAGANLGVSSRGLGSLQKDTAGLMVVQDDFQLATAADIVADPSAPDAFVKGIMENAEWVYDVAVGCWRAQDFVEESRKEMKKMTVEKVLNPVNQVKLFERFINKLAEK